MKKFLSTALALGMVAGLAATASALELKVTGKYVADGYYIDQGNGAAGKPSGGVFPFDNSNAASDTWYEHTLQVYPTLVVNDKVSMKADIRFIERNTVWGSQDDTAVSDGNNFAVDKAWLLYSSPVGLWEVGRRPGGAWQGPFLNNATKADRIMVTFPAMDAIKSYVFLQKSEEGDGYVGPFDDADNDYYEGAVGYEAQGMKGWLAVGYTRDMAQNFDFPNQHVVDTDEQDWWRIKGFGDVAINETFGLNAEFDYKNGDKAEGRIDVDAWAFNVNATGKFGALSSTLGYFMITGADGNDEAYDRANGTGWDFEPLYILTGNAANVLNGYRGPNQVGTLVRNSGVHAIVALADYAVSEDLTLHGGVGYAMADEEPAGFDDEYGWEFNLGLAYKLYDNLTYEAHFGWWAVGDFLEMGSQKRNTEDVYLLSHHLSMKF